MRRKLTLSAIAAALICVLIGAAQGSGDPAIYWSPYPDIAVTITSPSEGQRVDFGETIVVSATATDLDTWSSPCSGYGQDADQISYWEWAVFAPGQGEFWGDIHSSWLQWTAPSDGVPRVIEICVSVDDLPTPVISPPDDGTRDDQSIMACVSINVGCTE